MLDLVIQGGKIADGSGAPWYRADIGVKDGVIVEIGALQHLESAKVIDAADLVVSPGFIDIHSHDDLHIFENKGMDCKLRQGVTTTVIGNCGFGLFPVTEPFETLFRQYASGLFGLPKTDHPFGYPTLETMFADLQASGVAINVASLVAHGVMRISAMGYENRRPTPSEMSAMKQMLRQSMQDGAVGMSIGLIYVPAAFADTQELVELCKVLNEEGGLLTAHIRNESKYLVEAVQEVIAIAKQSGVPLEISHFKAVGSENFGKAREALQLLLQARAEGVDVTFDKYPYPAGSTTATFLLPPWALEGGVESMLDRLNQDQARLKKEMTEGIPGASWEPLSRLVGWENVMISSVYTSKNKPYEGGYISQLAERQSLDPIDFFLELMIEESGKVKIIAFQEQVEEMEGLLSHDLAMIGSDGIPSSEGNPHPRLYGTFPRMLGHYVRQKELLTLEKAVQKMTALPAARLGLMDRGLIRPGMAADLTIFDPQHVNDLATFRHPRVFPSGIQHVIVNGACAIENGEVTGVMSGRPLRRDRSVPRE